MGLAVVVELQVVVVQLVHQVHLETVVQAEVVVIVVQAEVVVQLVHQDPVVQLVLVEVVEQVVGVLHCLLVVYILLQAVGHADL